MRRGLAGRLAVGVMIIALAGCAAPAAGLGSGPAATAGPPVAVLAAVASTIAGPGQEEPRSAVPWGRIGHGWALAVDEASPSNPAPRLTGSVILYLVDPLGGRYRLYSAPAKAGNPMVAGLLADWSGDGERALFWDLPTKNNDASGPVYQLDLRTGRFSRVPVAASKDVLGYTRPRGNGLIAEVTNNGALASTVELLNLSGAVSQRLWYGWIQATPISSPDGSIIAIPSNDGVHLISRTGARIRVLARNLLCSPLRWWDQTAILATCATGAMSDSQNIWLLPVSGAKPVALTPPRPSSGPDQADYDLFRLSSGSYVDAMSATCGDDEVARVEPGGKVKVLRVPGATNADIITATATRLLLQFSSGGCSWLFPERLAWFDPVTGKETVAIPVPRNQSGVLEVIPYFDQGQR